jgi:tRNA threonylcarbamoyladenosine biosynthesis protein TsaE
MFISRSATETEEFGAQLARRLNAGDVLALCGELGSGKTQLVKGIARGLGSAGAVTSPTFTIVHEYPEGRLPLYHFDFYRLENSDDLRGIDFDEYLGATGVCVIEWADKFPSAITRRAAWLRLQMRGDGSRTIELRCED